MGLDEAVNFIDELFSGVDVGLKIAFTDHCATLRRLVVCLLDTSVQQA